MGVPEFDGEQGLEDVLDRAHAANTPEGIDETAVVDVPTGSSVLIDFPHTRDTLWDRFFYKVGFPLGLIVDMPIMGMALMASLVSAVDSVYPLQAKEIIQTAAVYYGGGMSEMAALQYLSERWYTDENEALYITPEGEHGVVVNG